MLSLHLKPQLQECARVQKHPPKVRQRVYLLIELILPLQAKMLQWQDVSKTLLAGYGMTGERDFFGKP